MKVKTFDGCFCSQKLFARVIGKTPAWVFQLKLFGVVKFCTAGILIFQSLENYFNSYLPPNKRKEELKAAIDRVQSFSADTESNFLQSARRLQKKVDAAQMKLTFLKFFNRIDGNYAPPNLIETAAQELLQLKQELSKAKQELQAAIIAAKIRPLQIENILLYRYVNGDNFFEVAESCNYSLRYVFSLHRQGLKLLSRAENC